MALGSLFATRSDYKIALNEEQIKTATITAEPEISDFEKAVQLIKKYEGLHQPKHYPLVGYGHLVLPGEKFSRSKAMSEAEADKLLRKDLLKNCAVFRNWGADSLILGVLAYNIGSGNALRSSVAKKLKAGDRNIYDNYVAHARYKGKIHSQIQRRRIEEYETLFIKNPINDSKELNIEEVEISKESVLASVLTGRTPMDGSATPMMGLMRTALEKIGDIVTAPANAFEGLAKSVARMENNFGSQIKEQTNKWIACI